VKDVEVGMEIFALHRASAAQPDELQQFNAGVLRAREAYDEDMFIEDVDEPEVTS
jgi:hypothetical protein